MPVSASISAGGFTPGTELGSTPQTPLAALAPYDQSPYYAIPTETPVTIGGTALRVVKADPMRVRLVLSANLGAATATGTGVANVSINPGVNANNGIPLTLGGPTLVVTWELWGPLVQQAWFAIGSAGVTGNVVVTAQEVRLIRWPGQLGDKPITEMYNGKSYPAGCPDNNRIVSRINGNRGTKPQTYSDSDISALIKSCASGFEYSRNGNNWLAPDSWRVSSGIR